MTAPLSLVPSLYLIGDDEPSSSTAFALDRDVTLIGRDQVCHVVLTPPTISRRHAQVVRRGDGYELEDLGSKAGTLLNGKSVTTPIRLKDGDRIGISRCTLVYSEPDDTSKVRRNVGTAIVGVRDVSVTVERELAGFRSEEKLRALLEIGREVVGSYDLQEVLERTLDALFRIFPQAERGFVVLKKDEVGGPGPKAVKVRNSAEGPVTVSRTVFEHVVRNGQAVLSEDVAVDDRFDSSRSVDEAQIRTLICAPIKAHRRRPIGIIQLDTRDRQAQFSQEDLDVLAAVASQISATVDNALLLAAAARERQRLALIAEAGAALASSLDLTEILSTVARLVVPHLADLCIIDLREDDSSVRTVAAAHADPAKQELVDEVRRRYPPDLNSPHPAIRVLRTGLALTAHGVTDELLVEIAKDPEHLDLLRRIGLKSYIIVPLIARERILGALMFADTEGERQYGPADLELAEELSRRSALALDNAAQHQAAQEARRQAEVAGGFKDLFLAMLSHELRTPLTPALLGLSGMLDDPETPEALRPTLEAARRGIAVEARLVDDLLDLTRIATGKLRVNPERINAHTLVRQAVSACEDDLTSGKLQLELDLAATDVHVEADPSRVQQVLWNLIKNAAKFTPPGGTVWIRTRNVPATDDSDGGTRLVVEVADTGIGIEPEFLPRIFHSFEQGHDARQRHSGGLGLGLAISLAIVEAHGGQLTAESEGAGRGATFRFDLLSMPTSTLTPEPEPAHRISLPPRSLNILLVEDDMDTATVLSRLLRRRGYTVTSAGTVAEARQAAETDSFSLVISDMGLPDGTGIELVKWLGERDSVPAIALTGYGMENDLHKTREAGFLAHLTKPVDFPTLEETIRRVTDR